MEAETTQPTTYRVPEANYEHLKAQIAKLQNRAAKLGSGEITLVELGHEDWIGYRVRVGEFGDERISYFKPGTGPKDPKASATGDYRRYFHIQVTGDKPKLNGWRFAATLDATYNEEGKFLGNVLRVVPGFEIPETYRTTPTHCDHCGHKRTRKNTFIVQHEDGTRKQIGRQCIKDFLGHASPEQYARFAEYLLSVADLAYASEGDDWHGGHQISRYGVKDILQATAMLVRTFGWKSKAFEQASTASFLLSYIAGKGNDADKFREANPVTDADIRTGDTVFVWLQSLANQPRLSDYLYNLSLLTQAGAVETKAFGLLASAISAYARAKEIELSRKEEKQESNWIGAPAERIEVTLTLKSKYFTSNDFGAQTKCKYTDESGNVIIWWASRDITDEIGTKIRAKFTIKKHEEYQGLKQTVVTRLTVLEEIQQVAAIA